MYQEPLPVVLVHGLFAPRATMRPFQWTLRRAGFDAHTVKLPFLNMSEVTRSAAMVAAQVEQILARTNQQRCDLVGLSLGGLLGLHYLQSLGGAERVRRMIALGTPVRGSDAAQLAVTLLGRAAPAAAQVRPGSDFLSGVERAGLPEGVEIVAVYASYDPVAPAERCRIEGVRNIEIPTWRTPLAHQTLITSPAAMRALISVLRGN